MTSITQCIACNREDLPLTPLTVEKTRIYICSLHCLHAYMKAISYGQHPSIKDKGLRKYDQPKDKAV